jgi:L-lysine 2,3-aminomutase
MPHPMPESVPTESREHHVRTVTAKDLEELTTRAGMAPEQRLRIRAAAAVFGFRTTRHVTEELIDWSAAPDDPIYRLVFPDEHMLPATDVAEIADLLRQDAPAERLEAMARQVWAKLTGDHVPGPDEQKLPGVHHSYRDALLVAPAPQAPVPVTAPAFGGTRWTSGPGQALVAGDVHRLTDYLIAHPEVTYIQLSGADPLISGAAALRRYIEPLMGLEQLESIHIDTSALACWPHRFLTDPDAENMLRLFEQVTASGKSLTLVAAFYHPRELEPAPVTEAVGRIHATGAVIRTQAPLIGSVNDAAHIWAAMWRTQVRMGMVPYAMLLERPTAQGSRLTVPLAQAHEIFTHAYAGVAGLGRTVRGPAMLTSSGTVCVDGITDIGAQRVFVLRFTHARDLDLIGEPFFAAFDPDAVWLTDLKPALSTRFPHQPAAETP